jgi:hypothetical protein
MSRPDPVTREIPPCKDCRDRHPGCHDKCDGYKAWKMRLEEINNKRKEYDAKPFVQYDPFNY